ncbi:hypothetical protein [Campylobacter upsaliensis]|uniref:hypothetical protein n=1 Tax=Campylobacter upsaliensis TaxID=28080 RepID=UPI000E1A3D26|nr:hypothetical protein [Campylobacter upsaliensis]ECZ4670441.1 hypothetical protein [Campylobacter upsaliensis]SUX12946.1 transmembrane protein [Campylobacter upsaliensis]
MKNKKREFIEFDKLFYVKKDAFLENDVLFESVVEELHLNNAFEYQMSVFRENENAHIFLTHIKNLDKKESVYPQPLIFSMLYPKWVKEKKFCVVFFGETLSFISYFENGYFTGLKNLPQFSLRDLDLKENRDLFFQNYGILELLEQNDLILSVNDKFAFGVWLSEYHRHLSVESFFREEAQKTLCSLCHFSNETDFIKKNEFSLKPFILAFLLFSFCFLGTLGVLFWKDYPKYTQNKITKQNNENLKADLKKLNENLFILEENLKDLNRTYKNNTLLLRQNEELLAALAIHFKKDEAKSLKLYEIFSFLNQNGLKISSLSLKDSIRLVFNAENDYIKALEKIEKNNIFEIINANSKELILELKNE